MKSFRPEANEYPNFCSMSLFAIVIVAKNSADKIGMLLKSIQGLSDEIWVCDTGSSDDTMEIAKSFGVIVHQMLWEGYGTTKRKASLLPRKDWILLLDSDEEVSPELYQSLQAWQPADNQTVYSVIRPTFLGNQWIRYSDWGNDWQKRLFNRQVVNWDDAIAHEDLRSAQSFRVIRLKGQLNHYSFTDTDDYVRKMINYALLRGREYHLQGKKSSWLKRTLSPPFTFLKCYIFKLGFLDGQNGWLIAHTTAYYTFLKYTTLSELNKEKTN